MTMLFRRQPDTPAERRSDSTQVTPWRRGVFDDVAQVLARAVAGGPTGDVAITSTQWGGGDTVVVVTGPVDAQSVHRLALYLQGLLRSGTRRLSVDISRVTVQDDQLLGLLHAVEVRTLALGGVFELTGFLPPALYAMEDGVVTEVFALYRAALDDDDARATTWAALSCPQGLSDVAEPGTRARHRAILDLGASA
jgi:anti-anti-sigma regulatory factor